MKWKKKVEFIRVKSSLVLEEEVTAGGVVKASGGDEEIGEVGKLIEDLGGVHPLHQGTCAVEGAVGPPVGFSEPLPPITRLQRTMSDEVKGTFHLLNPSLFSFITLCSSRFV